MFAHRGADYEEIAEGLFAPAAQRMGDRWLTDQASWVDVNIGSSTLARTHIAFRSMLKQTAPVFEASAIFGSFAGQAHILGLSFATEYFRRNGWNVRHIPGAKQDTFIAAVANEAPDIVGFTAATDSDLQILNRVVEQLRKLPSSPRIIVGGSSPELALLDADAVVSRLDMGLLAGHRLLV
jgi:methanogenic corrinoid protein MtbC1